MPNAQAHVYRVPAVDQGWAFFFDVDGTLIEPADRPGAVREAPGLIALLTTLQEIAPLALVSGRMLSDLDRLFAPLRLPAAGQHGTERRRADGRVEFPSLAAAELATARFLLQSWAAAHPGTRLEDRGLTLALHYRDATHLRHDVARAVRAAVRKIGRDFVVVPGHLNCEIRPRGYDKSRAIAAFTREAPFARRVPVVVGDDVTNEGAFALVNRLGGHSIKVGAGCTVARWRLGGVADVLAWLDRGVQRLCAFRQPPAPSHDP